MLLLFQQQDRSEAEWKIFKKWIEQCLGSKGLKGKYNRAMGNLTAPGPWNNISTLGESCMKFPIAWFLYPFSDLLSSYRQQAEKKAAACVCLLQNSFSTLYASLNSHFGLKEKLKDSNSTSA